MNSADSAAEAGLLVEPMTLVTANSTGSLQPRAAPNLCLALLISCARNMVACAPSPQGTPCAGRWLSGCLRALWA